MITIIFEDNVDFYFARQRVLEKLDEVRGSTFLPQGVRPSPGRRRHRPGPDLLVHRRAEPGQPDRPGTAVGAQQVLHRPAAELGRAAWPRWPRSAARRWNTRSTSSPEALRAYGITLGELYAAVAKSNCRRAAASSRRTTPSTSSAASAGSRTRRTSRTRSSARQGGHADLRQERGHGAAGPAVPPQRLREGRQRGGRRRRADAPRREPAGRHRSASRRRSRSCSRACPRACASSRPTTARG